MIYFLFAIRINDIVTLMSLTIACSMEWTRFSICLFALHCLMSFSSQQGWLSRLENINVAMVTNDINNLCYLVDEQSWFVNLWKFYEGWLMWTLCLQNARTWTINPWPFHQLISTLTKITMVPQNTIVRTFSSVSPLDQRSLSCSMPSVCPSVHPSILTLYRPQYFLCLFSISCRWVNARKM